jgi:hypothetical protein
MITLFPPKAIKNSPSKKKVLNARKICAPASQKKGLNIFICSLMQCKLAEGFKTAGKVESFCGERRRNTIKTHEKYKFIDFLINIL